MTLIRPFPHVLPSPMLPGKVRARFGEENTIDTLNTLFQTYDGYFPGKAYGLSVRLATVDDVEAIHYFIRRIDETLFGDKLTQAEHQEIIAGMKETYANKNNVTLIIQDEKQDIVGTATVKLMNKGRHAFLESGYIREDFRRKKLGEWLIVKRLERAITHPLPSIESRQPIHSIALTAKVQNQPILSLCQKLGFVKQAHQPFSDRQVMVLTLPDLTLPENRLYKSQDRFWDNVR